MGLFGALIVRPALGADHAYDDATSRFTACEEFMVLLSEIDPYQHQAVEKGNTFNINNYHPRYWLINGRGFPDSIADNGASWLPNQPYGALASVSRTTRRTPTARHGALPQRRHRGLPVPPARQQRARHRPGRAPARPAPGRTCRWRSSPSTSARGRRGTCSSSGSTPRATTGENPVTVTVPSLANQVVGVFYSGSPYLGSRETLPPGTQTLNQCGEYYIISHNHALYQITSWGANMTGPITYMRINPPAPNSCG